MKKLLLPAVALTALLFGCAAVQEEDSTGSTLSAMGAEANAFNPYMNSQLPHLRQISDSGGEMLKALGATTQSIEGEARHRKNWRDEIYPVVFGDRKAPGEIIAVLNFANPDSERVWSQVVEASKQIAPERCKIVVFGHSDENYGTDLMGMAIWLVHSRKGQAMPWLTYALSRWNAVKAAQKSAGGVKKFTNEYDATATTQDMPIIYGYLGKVQPPVPTSQELSLSRYCYDAGNVNMYQATQVCKYYGVGKLPAVIVNGKNLGKPTAEAILAALR